ncbi:MAG: hypothetical protein ACREHC_05935 [Candidatus Levyibacteriota bacterium]
MSEFSSEGANDNPLPKENNQNLQPIPRGGRWRRRMVVGAVAVSVAGVVIGELKPHSTFHENDAVTSTMVHEVLPAVQSHVAAGLKITDKDVTDAKKFDSDWGDLTINVPDVGPAKVVIKYKNGIPTVEKEPGSSFADSEQQLKKEGAPSALLKDLNLDSN